MTKYLPIITQDPDSYMSEIYQRLAFTFDYSWSDGVRDVRKLSNANALLFDPNSRSIQMVKWETINRKYYGIFNTSSISDTIEKFLAALRKPEKEVKKFTLDGSSITAEISDTHTRFQALASSVEVPNDFIKKISAYLAESQPDTAVKSTGLIVSFFYPDSQSNRDLLREVRVTNVDARYICGYEVKRGDDDAVNPDKQLFKKYSRKSISLGGEINLRTYQS